jgi:hypothetical protein
LDATKITEFKADAAADSERPFVAPIVWALYSALRLVLSIPTGQLLATSTGVDLVKSPAEVTPTVKAALPHRADHIDQYGFAAFPSLVEELEEELLRQIMLSLEGGAADSATIKRAGEIMKLVDRALAPEVPPVDPAVQGAPPAPT